MSGAFKGRVIVATWYDNQAEQYADENFAEHPYTPSRFEKYRALLLVRKESSKQLNHLPSGCWRRPNVRRIGHLATLLRSSPRERRIASAL